MDLTWPPPYVPPTRARRGETGTSHFEGLTYARTPGYRPVLLDLHVPAADTPPPVVVWIHGGAWLEGDRRFPPPTVTEQQLFGGLLAAGLAVATVDYRHSREAHFPAQLHDVKAAVRYLRRFADPFGVDGSRIGVWGESAGGHLAALLALTGPGRLEGTEGVPGEDSTVSAVVDWYGVSDLPAMGKLDRPAPPGRPVPERQLVGGSEEEWPELALAASPVAYADRVGPPFLLIHGLADTIVPHSQSEVLADRLRDSGTEVELHSVPGADHIFMGVRDVGPLVAESVAFLRDRLG
ncbi:alpha/beta hydrolase [Actinokineospora auranticolor]|uniref:Acetyl esterase/lipase n=1 Tax=Actinokineospora auranticolor TaxID=155976 RepID=A0A2S6GEG6_9PSEU|nr:alpha/beta hydrolase [Actinokineospora auranticolor]PPK63627.1 acetyl esterase/lipase [Actinokineospora auranticolor]